MIQPERQASSGTARDSHPLPPLRHALARNRRPEPDIGLNRSRKQKHILKHDGERAAQITQIEFAMFGRRAGFRPSECRKSASADLSSWSSPRRCVRQSRPTRPDSRETKRPAEPSLHRYTQTRHSEIRFRPTRPARAATGSGWIDDCGRRVDQLEQALRTRHRGLQDVVLLAHVGDRLKEALRILNERHQRAKRQRALISPGRRRTR